MKSINVHFEDEEIERLESVKGDKPWHDFILELAPEKSKEE